MNTDLLSEWASGVFSNFSRASCIETEVTVAAKAKAAGEDKLSRYLLTNAMRRRREGQRVFPKTEFHQYLSIASELDESDRNERLVKALAHGVAVCMKPQPNLLASDFVLEKLGVRNHHEARLKLYTEQERLSKNVDPQKNAFEYWVYSYTETSAANRRFLDHPSAKSLSDEFEKLIITVPNCIPALLFRADHALNLFTQGGISGEECLEYFSDTITAAAKVESIDGDELIINFSDKGLDELLVGSSVKSGLPVALKSFRYAKTIVESSMQEEEAISNQEHLVSDWFDVTA